MVSYSPDIDGESVSEGQYYAQCFYVHQCVPLDEEMHGLARRTHSYTSLASPLQFHKHTFNVPLLSTNYSCIKPVYRANYHY